MPVPAPAATPTPTAPRSCVALNRSTEPTSAAPTASAAASCPPVPATMSVTVSRGPENVVSLAASTSMPGSAGRAPPAPRPPRAPRKGAFAVRPRAHHAAPGWRRRPRSRTAAARRPTPADRRAHSAHVCRTCGIEALAVDPVAVQRARAQTQQRGRRRGAQVGSVIVHRCVSCSVDRGRRSGAGTRRNAPAVHPGAVADGPGVGGAGVCRHPGAHPVHGGETGRSRPGAATS